MELLKNAWVFYGFLLTAGIFAVAWFYSSLKLVLKERFG